MLTKTDLQIDDWVKIKTHTEFKVSQMKEQNFVQIFTEFEPIELTDEILIKNGFVPEMLMDDNINGYRQWFGNIIIPMIYANHTDNSQGYAFNSNHNLIIHYVHELQHLLKLCGVKKQIVL